ncbi:hypothetical protein GCM10023116_44110 [Kistimonas scapharcae]|uniref:RING-type domain-containing protein n=2 Tax=Kistimonas scapharcae TaxID=1036133 RepID=A0ABP8VAX9_9GAMM
MSPAIAEKTNGIWARMQGGADYAQLVRQGGEAYARNHIPGGEGFARQACLEALAYLEVWMHEGIPEDLEPNALGDDDELSGESLQGAVGGYDPSSAAGPVVGKSTEMAPPYEEFLWCINKNTKESVKRAYELMLGLLPTDVANPEAYVNDIFKTYDFPFPEQTKALISPAIHFILVHKGERRLEPRHIEAIQTYHTVVEMYEREKEASSREMPTAIPSGLGLQNPGFEGGGRDDSRRWWEDDDSDMEVWGVRRRRPQQRDDRVDALELPRSQQRRRDLESSYGPSSLDSNGPASLSRFHSLGRDLSPIEELAHALLDNLDDHEVQQTQVIEVIEKYHENPNVHTDLRYLSIVSYIQRGDWVQAQALAEGMQLSMLGSAGVHHLIRRSTSRSPDSSLESHASVPVRASKKMTAPDASDEPDGIESDDKPLCDLCYADDGEIELGCCSAREGKRVALCVGCMDQWFGEKAGEFDAWLKHGMTLPCPMVCDGRILTGPVENKLPENSDTAAMFRKFHQKLGMKLTEEHSDGRGILCMEPQCDFGTVIDKHMRLYQCANRLYHRDGKIKLYCALCSAEASYDHNCPNGPTRVTREEIEARRYYKRNLGRWKRCPQCKTMTERIVGCNHMSCKTCKHHYCWKCLGPFYERDGRTMTHQGYYTCFGFGDKIRQRRERNAEYDREIDELKANYRRVTGNAYNDSFWSQLRSAVCCC